jgi:hypothetical protein
MSLSLYNIEDALQSLVDLREQAESEGDSEALRVIDQQLREYLTKEAAKVTSYVALIRSRELTAVACGIEIERLRRISIAAQNDVERLKANALAVMQQFGVRELKATPGGGLKIQGNGGREPLEITDPERIVVRYQTVKLKLNGEHMVAISEASRILLEGGAPISENMRAALGELLKMISETPFEPDTERIREALVRGESVPGAKLLERGEHLRVL